jgi:Coenzyme PQQ synthesis protein D (PqqD)
MAIELGAVLRRCPDVRFRIVDGEAVVLRQRAAEVMVLNEVAARILDLADGKRPVGSWIEALLEEYEVERDTLVADVLDFAADLLAQGVLEEEERSGRQERRR